MTEIPSTPADGNQRVDIVMAIADLTAPKLTELNAASSEQISCYLSGSGYKPSLTEQVIADERMCSRQTFEQPGRSQRGLELEYIDNTNTPDEADFNKAKDVLKPGTRLFVVARPGIDFEAPYAVGQTVIISPIRPGQYNYLPPEANSVQKIGQKQFVTGKTVESKIAA